MKKPTHYLVFKILAAVFFVVLSVGLILLFTGFGDFETDNYIVGMIMMPIGWTQAGTASRVATAATSTAMNGSKMPVTGTTIRPFTPMV